MTDQKITYFDINYNNFNMKTDILLPFHGQYEKTIKCIESILRLTKKPDFNLCVIDDFSPNVHFHETLKKYPKTKVLRNEKHLGFGGSLMQGFKNTDNPYILIIHSDCEIVESNWLLEMGKSLYKLRSDNIRMISSRMDNVGDYDPKLKGEPNLYTEDVVAEGCLPLICVLAHRELFNKINGFIKPYYPAFYEDEELANRMKYYGFKQGICGKSFVKHEGRATISEMIKNNPKFKNIMEENYNYYLKDIRNF